MVTVYAICIGPSCLESLAAQPDTVLCRNREVGRNGNSRLIASTAWALAAVALLRVFGQRPSA